MGRPPSTPDQRKLKGKAVRDWQVDEGRLGQLGPLDDWVPSGGDAVQGWYRRLAGIVPPGTYKASDGVLLECLAEALVLRDKANGELAAGGHILVDDRGREYPSPWLAIRQQAISQVAKFLPKLGLTPADRAKLVQALPARGLNRKTKKMLTR